MFGWGSNFSDAEVEVQSIEELSISFTERWRSLKHIPVNWSHPLPENQIVTIATPLTQVWKIMDLTK
jgi:hypothetical protein